MPENVHRLDWDDLGYTGIATIEGRYLVSWRVLEISGWEMPENGGAVIGWWAKGESSGWPPATDPADAESVVDIDVKWDGCANYSWNPRCATHTCEGGKELAGLILRVHEVSSALMAEFVD